MWQYYIMLGAGFCLLILAAITFKSTIAFLRNGEKVTGTVTSLREIDSDGVVYMPVFTYHTKDNIAYTFELAEGTNPPSWSEGDTEVIIYDPKDPSKVELYTYFRIFAWPLILISIALPLLVIGGGYFIAERYLI